MAATFEEQLGTELSRIQSELERLENRRKLVQELLGQESGSGAASASASKPTRRRAVRRTGATAKRTRRPRGLITGKVREFLGKQREPAHATEILKFLEENDAAPQSAKPMPTLQSTLQRMKEMGEIENTGRNRWQLLSSSTSTESGASSPADGMRSDGPPVVTSTTTFGSRPLGSQ